MSVSGRVDGECLVITAVNSTGNAVDSVETIAETTLETCCRVPSKKVSFDDSKLLEGVAALLDERFDKLRDEMSDAVDERLGELLDPDGGALEEAGPGVWLGLGFKADGGLSVTGTLPGSPAAGGAVKKGDVVRAVNSAAVDSLDQLIALLAELSVFEPFMLSLQRGDKEVEAKVTGSPRLLPNGDMISAFTMNKACGEDCECSKTERRSICGKAWRYLGDHESGALAYEEQCITINPRNTPSKTMHVCGVALFI